VDGYIRKSITSLLNSRAQYCIQASYPKCELGSNGGLPVAELSSASYRLLIYIRIVASEFTIPLWQGCTKLHTVK